MKRTFILLFIIIMSACSTYEYTYNTLNKPKDGNNTIVIFTKNKEATNYKDFGGFLSSKGFSFESTNNDFYTFITAPKHHTKGEAAYKLNVNFTENKIVIRPKILHPSFGAIMAGGYENTWVPWQHDTSNGSLHFSAFKDFMPMFYEFSNNIEFQDN